MKPSEYFEQTNNDPHSIKAQPVGLWAGGLILANFDEANHPQVIIEFNPIGGLSSSNPISRVLETNGLTLGTREMLINGVKRTCAVLKGKNATDANQFIALSDHFVSQLSNEEKGNGDLAQVEKTIKKWVEFFKPKLAQTSREKILGLIGELLTISNWLDVSNLNYSAWRGPIGGLHDFVGKSDSLEVKVCGSRKGPIVHQVSDVDQLVPTITGTLKVLSYRISLGNNLSSSVHDLVSLAAKSEMFDGPAGQDYFQSALQSAGYNENLEAALSRFDLIDQGLYLVGEDFPTMKVQKKDLDSRIVDITYSVDFSALEEHKIASEPLKVRLN